MRNTQPHTTPSPPPSGATPPPACQNRSRQPEQPGRTRRPDPGAERAWHLSLQTLDNQLEQIAHRIPPYPPQPAPDNPPPAPRATLAPDTILPRLEYKYLIPGELLPRLRRMIAPFVETDAHAVAYGARGYTVRSIYFDTRALDFYHQKLAGLQTRKKLRLRGYNGGQTDSPVFLEIKRKHAARVTKNRAPVQYAHVPDLLLSGDIERYILTRPDCPQAQQDARRFLFFLRRDALRPTALIVYEREAFHGKFDSSQRITLDKNLRSALYPPLDALFREEKMRYAMPHHLVLEVKFTHKFPAWLKPIIRALDLKQEAVSKYTIGINKQTTTGHTRRAAPVMAPTPRL